MYASNTKPEKKARTRYAPSPTGFQHLGGIRTAVINYLLAKSLGGDFIVRIEDTDTERYVEGAENYIYRALEWLGIRPLESPAIGGPYGPYKQSQRIDIYKQYALLLVEKGHAYYAFDTEEDLRALREKNGSEGNEFLYNCLNRHLLNNTLNTIGRGNFPVEGQSSLFTIRLKLPENHIIRFCDEVRGEILVNTNQLEDKVLLKANGWATYHLASIVDDYLMQITHVIRGEEWLPSAPVHAYIYEAMGWSNSMPKFAHLPLILNPDGKGKLSKRKLKDSNLPIFPLNWKNEKGDIVKGLKEEGFLPDAVLNLLALYGWNNKDNCEVYSRDALFSSFDFKNIVKSGARFDYEKAKWINSQHIRNTPAVKLRELFINLFLEPTDAVDSKKLLALIEFMKDKITTLKDLLAFKPVYTNDYFFEPDTIMQHEISTIELPLKKIVHWERNSISSTIKTWTANSKISNKIYPYFRYKLTGNPTGIDVFVLMEIIGKEETLKRLF